MQNNDILNRHAARFIAIMAMYSHDMQDKPLANLTYTAKAIESAYLTKDVFDPDLPKMDDVELYAPDEEFLSQLINLQIERQEDIMNLIESSLIAKWNISKVDKVIKAILQLAASELLAHADVHAKIIIDEYVSLTKTFYEDSEAGFVNKVIDTMARAVRTEV